MHCALLRRLRGDAFNVVVSGVSRTRKRLKADTSAILPPPGGRDGQECIGGRCHRVYLLRSHRGTGHPHRDYEGRARRSLVTAPRRATPPYERLSGKFYGELDPADPEERPHHRHQAGDPQRARQGRVRRHVLADEADRSVEGERRVDVFGRQSRQRRGGGERGGTHFARQRLAGRRRADRHQPDDSGAPRQESRRQQHHRAARRAAARPERQHRHADRFRAARRPRIRPRRSTRRKRRWCRRCRKPPRASSPAW